MESEFTKEFIRSDDREKNMLFNVSEDDEVAKGKVDWGKLQNIDTLLML